MDTEIGSLTGTNTSRKGTIPMSSSLPEKLLPTILPYELNSLIPKPLVLPTGIRWRCLRNLFTNPSYGDRFQGTNPWIPPVGWSNYGHVDTGESGEETTDSTFRTIVAMEAF